MTTNCALCFWIFAVAQTHTQIPKLRRHSVECKHRNQKPCCTEHFYRPAFACLFAYVDFAEHMYVPSATATPQKPQKFCRYSRVANNRNWSTLQAFRLKATQRKRLAKETQTPFTSIICLHTGTGAVLVDVVARFEYYFIFMRNAIYFFGHH